MIDGRDSSGYLKSLKLGIESWLFRLTARRIPETKEIHNFTGAVRFVSRRTARRRAEQRAPRREILLRQYKAS